MFGLEHGEDQDLKLLIRSQSNIKSVETAGVAQAQLSDILFMVKEFKEVNK